MTTMIENGLQVRAPVPTDLTAICELANAWSNVVHGEPEFTEENFLLGWREPTFRLTDDSWIVETADGRRVGYAEVWTVQSVHWGMRLFSHPDYPRAAIEAELVRLAEKRAREGISEAPPHARVTLSRMTSVKDAISEQVFADAGFTPIRRHWRMRIDMDTRPPAPVWPEGITLATMRPGQEPAVHAALNEAFEDHWGHLPLSFDMWRAFFLDRSDFDPSLCFLAMAGDEIAGFSLCYPKQQPRMGWVDDLGVRRPWRRRRAALALLLHSFGEFYRRGERAVGLGVDAQSLTGANQLYMKAGMRPIREWQTYEKELHPGIELSTQSLA